MTVSAGSHRRAADALVTGMRTCGVGAPAKGRGRASLISGIEHVEAGPTEVGETLRHRCNDGGLREIQRRRRSGEITDVVEQAGLNRAKLSGESSSIRHPLLSTKI